MTHASPREYEIILYFDNGIETWKSPRKYEGTSSVDVRKFANKLYLTTRYAVGYTITLDGATIDTNHLPFGV